MVNNHRIRLEQREYCFRTSPAGILHGRGREREKNTSSHDEAFPPPVPAAAPCYHHDQYRNVRPLNHPPPCPGPYPCMRIYRHERGMGVGAPLLLPPLQFSSRSISAVSSPYASTPHVTDNGNGDGFTRDYNIHSAHIHNRLAYGPAHAPRPPGGCARCAFTVVPAKCSGGAGDACGVVGGREGML
jgi:hypothetical protein